MTSKEALEELKSINRKQNNGNGDIWLEMIIQSIQKDLEVLEILKKQLFIVEPDNEEDLKEFDTVDYLRLMDYMTRKDYQVIKEWLYNEE